MSKFYKRIHLDGLEAVKLKALELTEKRGWTGRGVFWNEFNTNEIPELVEIVQNALGTTIWKSSMLVLTFNSSTLHIDHTIGQRDQKARLNIPILNCERSRTSFFSIPPLFYKLSMVDANGTRAWPHRTFFTPVDSVILDAPTILRISEPHTVFCDGAYPRISLTLNLEEDPVKYLDQE